MRDKKFCSSKNNIVRTGVTVLHSLMVGSLRLLQWKFDGALNGQLKEFTKNSIFFSQIQEVRAASTQDHCLTYAMCCRPLAVSGVMGRGWGMHLSVTLWLHTCLLSHIHQTFLIMLDQEIAYDLNYPVLIAHMYEYSNHILSCIITTHYYVLNKLK